MILFLDTVSPLPEFSIIEDNKIIYSKVILNNNGEKMSNCLIPAYIDLEQKFFLSKKLKFLIINTGPGSYTALRIGIAFFSGLSLSKNIVLKGISCTDLFKYSILEKDLLSTAILINSSNNQQFLSIYDSKCETYNIHKVEKNLNTVNFKQYNLRKIMTNSNLISSDLIFLNKLECTKINFKELVFKNINKILNLPNKDIIEPIYISNNQLLN